jgi:hypothetical protein
MARTAVAVGLVAGALGLATWSGRMTADAAGGRELAAPPAVPVLVELFTSEGCSSCPPADLLLTRLVAEKTVGRAEIVALAFHVDYWNRLGWTDRFSAPAFTDRQHRYADAWKTDRVYTPQAVVDGRTEFVGTDVKRALEALGEAAARPHARVDLAPAGSADDPRLTIAVEPPAGAAFTADVHLAIAEDGLTSVVTAGENARKHLAHSAVVRSLKRIGRVTKGAPLRLDAVPLDVDGSWSRAALRAVVIVQDEKTREVHGTGHVRLGQAAAERASQPDAGRADQPAADRVGFPSDYRSFPLLRTTNVAQRQQLGTIYGNAAAAGVKELAALPYPNGSVLVFEWATPAKGADGAPVTGADGLWQRGEVVRIDVMRRQSGYGEAYGDKRAGDWEFASYTPDGKPFTPAVDAAACAGCHRTATAARDFVFRGRFPAAAQR